jgi:pyridoxamine 5'-phosphate oxidase
MTSGPRREPLDEAGLHSDPVEQFRRWFVEACAGESDADRMTLATAGRDGRPSARIVLLRGIEAPGFVFFTNYRSRKGRDIDDNPRVALLFHWPWLGRQVRVEGTAERLPAVESDLYFARRPVGSRLSAIVSPQSEVVSGRTELRDQIRETVVRMRRGRARIVRPEHWGGYRVTPSAFEFWQSGRHRLHDRLRYREVEPGRWRIERLAP